MAAAKSKTHYNGQRFTKFVGMTTAIDINPVDFPEHMIHFTGDRFMGPRANTQKHTHLQGS